MVARVRTDPEFRALMLEDGTRAAQAMGIAMLRMPPLEVLESTLDLRNLVVCTLCSCHPRAVLGYPPFSYKSAAYRVRAVRDPRGLIVEWGTVMADGLRVVDSAADYRWMVLPMRRDRRLERGAAGRGRARGRHDRGHGAAGRLTSAITQRTNLEPIPLMGNHLCGAAPMTGNPALRAPRLRSPQPSRSETPSAARSDTDPSVAMGRYYVSVILSGRHSILRFVVGYQKS